MVSSKVHEKPFVVGIDRHSSVHFFQATDPNRFSGTPFMDERNGNDYANQAICRLFGSVGIDCVFSSYAERVIHFIREEACRAVMFHTRLEEMGDTTEVILSRRQQLRLIFLYSQSQLVSDKYARMFVADGGFKQVKRGLYENDEGDLAMVKPDGVISLVEHLKDLFQDLIVDV